MILRTASEFSIAIDTGDRTKFSLNSFGILSPWGSSNYRPSAPFLYEVASHVKNCHFII